MTAKEFPRGRRILVAEDNEINKALIKDMLSIHEHNVVIAKNGEEAIELAKQHKPELILMDIKMPVMDGMEATRILKGMPEFDNVPIIALTASTGEESEKKQIDIGCAEHIAKPIQTKELFALLQKYLGDEPAEDKGS
ncbi:MAG: response regulator [Candidatus Anammoxibacter sp.]